MSAQRFLQHRLIFQELKSSFADPSSFSSVSFILAVDFLLAPFGGVRKSRALLGGSGAEVGVSHFKRLSGGNEGKIFSNFLNLPTARRQGWEPRVFVIKMIAAICARPPTFTWRVFCKSRPKKDKPGGKCISLVVFLCKRKWKQELAVQTHLKNGAKPEPFVALSEAAAEGGRSRGDAIFYRHF